MGYNLKGYEPKAGVYVLTNLINGKVYVGESLDISERLGRHFGNNSKNQQVVTKAIKKYGKENFNVYVEYLPDCDKETLIQIEKELIKRHDCLVPNGYNVLPEGTNRTGFKHSESTKKIIGDKKRGVKHSEERKQRRRDYLKVNNPWNGRNHTAETKKKLSEANIGKTHSVESRKLMSEKRIGNTYNLGNKATEETKKRMSEAHKRRHKERKLANTANQN